MRILFILLFGLFYLSCKTKHNQSEVPIKIGPGDVIIRPDGSMEIFDLSLEQIEKDLQSRIENDFELNSLMIHESILLKLYCDTSNCKVKNVLLDIAPPDMNEYHKEMFQAYFKGFDSVKCKVFPKVDKIREFWIHIDMENNKLTVLVTPGYEIR
jgi:hypothetical protein